MSNFDLNLLSADLTETIQKLKTQVKDADAPMAHQFTDWRLICFSCSPSPEMIAWIM
jgi:hypothetical protein